MRVFVLNCHILIKFCIQAPISLFLFLVFAVSPFQFPFSLSLAFYGCEYVCVTTFIFSRYILFVLSVVICAAAVFFVSHTLQFWSNFPMSLPKIECYNFPSRCKSQNSVRVFTVACCCCCWLHPFILFRYFSLSLQRTADSNNSISPSFHPIINCKFCYYSFVIRWNTFISSFAENQINKRNNAENFKK